MKSNVWLRMVIGHFVLLTITGDQFLFAIS